jgi:hypothetical protein
LLNASRRLWLLPVAVAAAFLLVLPFRTDDDFSNNALIVLEVLIATFSATVMISIVLVPGAVAHTWLVHTLEAKRVRLPVRVAIAVLSSPLIGAWIFLLPDVRGDHGVWPLYAASVALFASASVWYGSKHSGSRSRSWRTG